MPLAAWPQRPRRVAMSRRGGTGKEIFSFLSLDLLSQSVGRGRHSIFYLVLPHSHHLPMHFQGTNLPLAVSTPDTARDGRHSPRARRPGGPRPP